MRLEEGEVLLAGGDGMRGAQPACSLGFVSKTDCRRRELNPYSPFEPGDFKSPVSPSSTTPAFEGKSLYSNTLLICPGPENPENSLPAAVGRVKAIC